MSTVTSLYRSTLVAAALAATTLAAVPAAQAHGQGWRERGAERAWLPGPPVRWYRHFPRVIALDPDGGAWAPVPVLYREAVYRPRRVRLPELTVERRGQG